MNTLKISKKELVEVNKKLGAVYGQLKLKDQGVINIQASKTTDKSGKEIVGVVMTTFNGSTQVASSLKLEPGKANLDGVMNISLDGTFLSAVSALSGVEGDEYVLTDNGSVVSVAVGENVVNLNKKDDGLMPIEFDHKDKEKIEGQFALTSSEFVRAANAILFAAVNEENKNVGGVGLVFSASKLVLRATDSARLAEAAVEVKKGVILKAEEVDGEQKVAEELSCVLMPSVLKMVISGVTSDTVAIVVTKSHLLIQTGAEMYQLTLLNKPFPHKVFEGVRAVKTVGTATVNKNDILVALDVVSVVSALSVQKPVCIIETGEKDELVFFSLDKTSKCVVKVEASEGELPASVAFDVKFLRSAILNFQGEKIVLDLNVKSVSRFTCIGEEVLAALCPVNIEQAKTAKK